MVLKYIYFFYPGSHTVEVKDNASRGLADNQWHSVEVGDQIKCSSLGDFSSNMMLLQVMREGGSLSLIVDSSLASVHSLGSKPLRLDGILFLGMMTTMLMMMTLINTILNTTLGCKDFFCHRLQPWSL